MSSGFGQRAAERRDPVPVGEPDVAQRRGGEQREGLAADGQLSVGVSSDRTALQIPVEVTSTFHQINYIENNCSGLYDSGRSHAPGVLGLAWIYCWGPTRAVGRTESVWYLCEVIILDECTHDNEVRENHSNEAGHTSQLG